jgi:hypothetical protein
MNISLHLRQPGQEPSALSVRSHAASVYDGLTGRKPGFAEDLFSADMDPVIDRWYIGDEFCANRLPSAEDSAAFVRRAAGAGAALTLLTPPLTDARIDELVPVLECLAGASAPVDVTVNDWGLLFFLKERFPRLPLALGRLLNKGFKDPRLGPPETVMAAAENDRDVLEHATFDQPCFRAKASSLGISRFERDLMPYDPRTAFAEGPPAVSVYFPFGYVTTGRVCWPSTFAPGRETDFRPRRACGRPCEGRSLALAHPAAGFPLRQSGNTIFYLYPISVTEELLRRAGEGRVRLVYQGAAL